MSGTILGARFYSDKYQRLYEKGKAFTFSEYYTFATSEVKDFVADLSVMTRHHAEVVVPTIIVGGAAVTMELYAGIAYSAGSSLQGFNRNSDYASFLPQILLKLNPTISDSGTRFSGVPIPASAQGAFSTALIVPGTLPFKLNTSTKMLIRLTNTDAINTPLVGIRLNWFEY